MTDTQPSGIDLARAALASARAAAKTQPVQPDRKKTRSTRTSSRRAGDPMGLGSAITRMMTDRGWEPPEAGGSILDQWPTIAPDLADKVAAVRFEHDTGTLHLQPASDAYATQLRMFRPQLLKRIAEKTGSRTVRALRILPPGGTPTARQEAPEPAATAAVVEAPVRTRETASPGYRAALEAALDHKPDPTPTNPYVLEAMARQEAALRAGRQSEEDHREGVWEQTDAAEKAGPAPGSVEESLARARAYARKLRAGGAPRRAFDVA